jgi:hypothetical protein
MSMTRASSGRSLKNLCGSRLSSGHPKKQASAHNLNKQVADMRKRLSKQQQRAAQTARLLINPDDSSLMRWWDAATTVALLYTAFVTPIEIAFFPSDSPGWNMTSTELTYAPRPSSSAHRASCPRRRGYVLL